MLTTIIGLGLATPGHDWIQGYISTLSERTAPHRGLYVLGGTIAAGLHLLFVAWLGRRLESAWHGAAVAGLALFFLLEWVAAAFLPCDADCAWITPTGMAHYAVSFAAFVAIGLGVILFSVHLWLDGHHTPAVHAMMGLIVAAAIGLLIADLTGVWHGIVERTLAVLLAGWVVAVYSARRALRA